MLERVGVTVLGMGWRMFTPCGAKEYDGVRSADQSNLLLLEELLVNTLEESTDSNRIPLLNSKELWLALLVVEGTVSNGGVL